MANNQNLRRPGKKGECPNPNGRPKGAKSVTTYIRELLDKRIDSPKTPISDPRKKISVAETIALRLVQKAMNGEMQAIREIQDRTEGKSVETVNSNNMLVVPDWVKDLSQPVDR